MAQVQNLEAASASELAAILRSLQSFYDVLAQRCEFLESENERLRRALGSGYEDVITERNELLSALRPLVRFDAGAGGHYTMVSLPKAALDNASALVKRLTQEPA